MVFVRTAIISATGSLNNPKRQQPDGANPQPSGFVAYPPPFPDGESKAISAKHGALLSPDPKATGLTRTIECNIESCK
jgi:hypothetical protein